jgi:type IV pilus assembly protein PilY1
VSRPRTTRHAKRRDLRPTSGAGIALVCLAALLWPDAALAARRTFSSGSLVIPASIEYGTDSGVLSTYGLVYVTLWKNAERVAQGLKPVTFYWAVQPNKLSQYRCDTTTAPSPAGSATGRNAPPSYGPTFNDNDGCDFAISRASGQPVSRLDASNAEQAPFPISDVAYAAKTGPSRASTTHDIDGATTIVKYLGGAWIVDATDRQAFLGMLQSVPELAPFHKNGTGSASFVNVHSANADFTAPVASVLRVKPPAIALIGSDDTTFLTNVLGKAGICAAIASCGGTFSSSGFTSGVVYDYYPVVGDLLDTTSGYPKGRLNGTVNNRTYGLMWAGQDADPTNHDVANLAYFLDTKGNNFFAEYNAIDNFENNGSGNSRFQTTNGINDYHPDIATAEDCNDQYLPSGAKFRGGGGECLVYGGANQPYAQSGNFTFDGGQGSYKGFTARNAFATGVTQVLQVGSGPTVASAINKDNNPNKGLVLYLAGHKFDDDRFWGERIILNTIFSRLNPLTGVELARSEPVGYKNTSASPASSRVYQGTYVQQPLPDSGDVTTYNPAAAQMWQFPYTAGHLYEYDVTGLATTSQAFSANKNWDAAAQLPLPGDRDIFTYVGGSAHVSWKRITFDHTETESSCTDTNSDGKCDLSQLLAACNAAGVTTAALQDRSVNGAQAKTLGLLVQQVRGFCASHTPPITGTPNLTPTDNQCDTTRQTNRAQLGGVDHSSPALVGPSRYITDTPFSTRPVVAYAAGHDGMLHAFFVSTYSGASTGTWTAESRSLPAGVAPGQELWAFVPPGQVCGLASNNALVDGAINVVDVFGDFPYDANNDGVIDWTSGVYPNGEKPNHRRRWRTILTATAGLGGSELFALDVTNPLKPVLLWHLGGPTEHDGRWDANGDGAFGNGETFDGANPQTYAFKWHDWDDADSSTTHIPTDYNTTDATVIDAIKTGRYDYRNLGLSYSTAVAKVWNGASYQYLLFVTTNAADYTTQIGAPPNAAPTGLRGAEVFAIDIITGQKIWQWEHLYSPGDGAGVDNSIPPRMALGDIDANGSTDRIYVGDLEGHLWELAARDGRNPNYLPGSDDRYHSFPLFGTPAMTGTGADTTTLDLFKVNGTTPLAQQPLTTPIGQGRFTSVPPALETYLLNRLAMVVGTMGVDWAIAPFEPGKMFVIPVSPEMNTRLTGTIDVNAARNPLLYGILKQDAAWSIPLSTGERVYGMPRVVNNTIVFNTAFGSFSGDISTTTSDLGNLRIVTGDGSGTHTDTRTNDSKSFGGVLIMDGIVVVTTDTSIRVLSNAPSSLVQGGVDQRPFNRATPAIVKSWEVVPP